VGCCAWTGVGRAGKRQACLPPLAVCADAKPRRDGILGAPIPELHEIFPRRCARQAIPRNPPEMPAGTPPSRRSSPPLGTMHPRRRLMYRSHPILPVPDPLGPALTPALDAPRRAEVGERKRRWVSSGLARFPSRRAPDFQIRFQSRTEFPFCASKRRMFWRGPNRILINRPRRIGSGQARLTYQRKI
jgi:hypothetical protein